MEERMRFSVGGPVTVSAWTMWSTCCVSGKNIGFQFLLRLHLRVMDGDE